jgi:hypothetical protein
MSQLNNILERIAAIQVNIEVAGALRPNVILSEPYLPSQTDSTNCPFFINEVHGGPSDIPISAGQQYITDQIDMFLCVRRREANTDLKLGTKETVLWRDAVYAAFAKRVKLSNPADDNLPGNSHVGLPYVVDARITSWEAPVAYRYAEIEYIAFRFVLEVNEMYVTDIDK